MKTNLRLKMPSPERRIKKFNKVANKCQKLTDLWKPVILIPLLDKENHANSEVADVSQEQEKNKSARSVPKNKSLEAHRIGVPGRSKYILGSKAVNRKKGSYTRNKRKNFMKQLLEPHVTLWKDKDKVKTRYHIENMKFSDKTNGLLSSISNTSKKEDVVPFVQLEQLNMTCFDKKNEKEEKSDKMCTSKKRDLKDNGNLLSN
ncbi:uncharacterized protein LOC106458277 [Limulus polyphemus]|uniref:Uncharacterized protein LOC106458277 n=1 Tax=Limulus polyphemus TaxID=6850 RepID=A0ABM1S932_LIMPO|nr:uncharacterized protein LOC106458277 [Limulus polyphemus]